MANPRHKRRLRARTAGNHSCTFRQSRRKGPPGTGKDHKVSGDAPAVQFQCVLYTAPNLDEAVSVFERTIPPIIVCENEIASRYVG